MKCMQWRRAGQQDSGQLGGRGDRDTPTVNNPRAFRFSSVCVSHFSSLRENKLFIGRWNFSRFSPSPSPPELLTIQTSQSPPQQDSIPQDKIIARPATCYCTSTTPTPLLLQDFVRSILTIKVSTRSHSIIAVK